MKKRTQTVSLQELCTILSCTSRTIFNYRRAGLPVRKNNRFDLVKVQAWLRERQEARDTRDSENKGALLRWRRLREHNARIEVAQRRGLVVNKAAVVQRWETVLLAAKSNLLLIPRTLPPRLAGKPIGEFEGIVGLAFEQALQPVMEFRL